MWSEGYLGGGLGKTFLRGYLIRELKAKGKTSEENQARLMGFVALCCSHLATLRKFQPVLMLE